MKRTSCSKKMTSVVVWLAVSISLFLLGFILTLATGFLAFMLFIGGDVSVETVALCASGVFIALWSSGACWEKMWGVSAGQDEAREPWSDSEAEQLRSTTAGAIQ